MADGHKAGRPGGASEALELEKYLPQAISVILARTYLLQSLVFSSIKWGK